MQYLSFISWPLSQTINILEQQYWQLGWDVARLVFTMSAFGLSHHMGWTARGAVGALASAMFLGYAAHLLLSDWAIRKKIQQVRLCAGDELAVQPEYAELGKL